MNDGITSDEKKVYFDEKKHKYYYNDILIKTSVTELINTKIFPKFDTDNVIKKLLTSQFPNKYNEDLKNMDYHEVELNIKKKWQELGDIARSKGNLVHKQIEDYYNITMQEEEGPSEAEEDSIEFKYFKQFENDYKHLYIPYKTEFTVVDSKHSIAGTIDMLYKIKNDDDKNLVIFDWKTCKDIKIIPDRYCGVSNYLNLPNTKYWKYAVQLNIYKKILEDNYDKNVLEMYILVLNENQDTYKIYKIDPIKNIETLFSL